jgi:hypothetical protein
MGLGSVAGHTSSVVDSAAHQEEEEYGYHNAPAAKTTSLPKPALPTPQLPPPTVAPAAPIQTPAPPKPSSAVTVVEQEVYEYNNNSMPKLAAPPVARRDYEDSDGDFGAPTIAPPPPRTSAAPPPLPNTPRPNTLLRSTPLPSYEDADDPAFAPPPHMIARGGAAPPPVPLTPRPNGTLAPQAKLAASSSVLYEDSDEILAAMPSPPRPGMTVLEQLGHMVLSEEAPPPPLPSARRAR